MDYANPKYFDYLDLYASNLESQLDISELTKRVNLYRTTGYELPVETCGGIRNMIETMLKYRLGSMSKSLDFLDTINKAKERKLISKSIANRCHELRTICNKGVHPTHDFIETKRALILLDEIFRDYIYKSEIDKKVIPSIAINDEIFIISDSAQKKELNGKVDKASKVKPDSNIDTELKTVEDEEVAATESLNDLLNVMDDVYARFKELNIDPNDLDENAQSRFTQFDELLQSQNAVIAKVKKETKEIELKADDILNERDFIRKLLRGNGNATEEQQNVLDFPKTTGTTSRVLRVNGAAGTGKTLVLLAKILGELESNNQLRFDEDYKKAIIICFNKSLYRYIQTLLASVNPEIFKSIDVINFDLFVNQLIKPNTNYDTHAYQEYTQDVRFKKGWKIRYEESGDLGDNGIGKYEFLKAAIQKVAEKHPDKMGVYYLDIKNEQNIAWLNDELLWLEDRFPNAQAAYDYVDSKKTQRTGRGGDRKPNGDIRKIILEIWYAYEHILTNKNRYTVGQAVKRLLKSNELPKYDYIAIDEAQDLSLNSIRFLWKLRKNTNSYMYISADENQKLYERDFSWKKIADGINATTLGLSQNMRNSSSIQYFANRLIGQDSDYELAFKDVSVQQYSFDELVNLITKLSNAKGCTIGLIGFDGSWNRKLVDAGIDHSKIQSIESSGSIFEDGIYFVRLLANKGLEFDYVIVNMSSEPFLDREYEKRVRYVHFTRARKKLFIFYENPAPALLQEFYSDFIQNP